MTLWTSVRESWAISTAAVDLPDPFGPAIIQNVGVALRVFVGSVVQL